MVDVRVSARNMDLTDPIRTYCEEKVRKFDYLLEDATDITVELTESVSHRGADQDFTVEISVHMPRARIVVRETGADVYALVDTATDTLSMRLKRYKEKLRYWEGQEGWKADYVKDLEASVDDLVEEVNDYTNYTPKISKRIKLEDTTPIHAAQAIEQMELLGLSSYLFKDSDTGTWSMLRKSNNGYEIVAPV